MSILDEAAAWLAGRGVFQWPSRFRPEWIEGSIAEGCTWIARRAGAAVGTVTLTSQDPLWIGIDGRAYYVHRLAVRRSAAGTGAALLRWAADRTRASGYGYLRLDCVASNAGLRGYYERAGFAHRGDVVVHGFPGQRAPDGAITTLVSRYELASWPHESRVGFTSQLQPDRSRLSTQPSTARLRHPMPCSGSRPSRS